MLRHALLTNYHKDILKLAETRNVVSKIGHDVSTALGYVKRNELTAVDCLFFKNGDGLSKEKPVYEPYNTSN